MNSLGRSAAALEYSGFAARWKSRNALAFAAKDHGDPCHVPWRDQIMTIRYGGMTKAGARMPV
jgi:hypothetical protein